ncbi:methionyl-tRNA formyltransferase, mitochondrial [Plutella xylostella]|uniref:methionyl-tRNA formyltransferase, mitochondrial n=1 Tax=Plutella xylostella TaxID=51655 RepID=UPI002032617E|nr:methionyl-tRNA formyltransferase, mitochondrial [Plutella xylostella]
MRLQAHNLKSQLFKQLFNVSPCFSRFISSKKCFNVLFFGSDGIALSSLKKINDLRKSEKIINQLNIVTANSSKHKTIIEKYAESESIKTLSWPLQGIENAKYDIGLIVAFGHLIKKDLLEKFPLGMVNVHPSLLPRWRGAAPIVHTLLRGDEVTGVSLMKIRADRFDVGEIISQVKVPISEDVKLPELTEELSEIGANMLVQCLRTLPDCLNNAQPQSEDGVTYAKKISKDISEVRWSEMTSTEVYNLYRAIYGVYPLSTKFKDKQIKLFDAFIVSGECTNINAQIGSLEYCDKRHAIKVLCKDKRYIYFKSLRIVGKRKISATDFYNGYIKNVPSDLRNFVLCQ